MTIHKTKSGVTQISFDNVGHAAEFFSFNESTIGNIFNTRVHRETFLRVYKVIQHFFPDYNVSVNFRPYTLIENKSISFNDLEISIPEEDIGFSFLSNCFFVNIDHKVGSVPIFNGVQFCNSERDERGSSSERSALSMNRVVRNRYKLYQALGKFSLLNNKLRGVSGKNGSSYTTRQAFVKHYSLLYRTNSEEHNSDRNTYLNIKYLSIIEPNFMNTGNDVSGLENRL